MSFPDLERAAGRAAARLGVVAALTVGAGAVGTAGAVAAPPAPPPPPPAVDAPAPAGAPAAAPGAAAPPPVAVPVGLPAPPPPAPVVPPAPAVPPGPWDGIARCETGGDWHADTGNGRHGGLQLDPRTWRAYGGGEFAPQADEASREQQIVVGDRVRSEQGWDAWSSCADGISPG